MYRVREAFWRAIAMGPTLRRPFCEHNLRSLREGLAPYPRLADQTAGGKLSSSS
ncbi:hypothetical protein [Pseudomonas sp. P1.8]|uniref:hypothetical protein n=1 Tax=Pseudomonas sp. P1.8 TaxID=1699310 RepID=UPI003527B1D5